MPGSETPLLDGQWVVPLESGRIQPLGLGCAPMASSRWATQPQVYSDTPSDRSTLNWPKPPGDLPRDPRGAPWTPARKC